MGLRLNLKSNAILQGVSVLFPLVSLPIIYNSLGVEVFGQYVYITTFAIIISTFVEFSFIISSQYRRKNLDFFEVVQLNNEIFSSKLYLFLVAIVIYILFFYFYNSFFLSLEFFVLYLSALIPVLVPQWILQGSQAIGRFSKVFVTLKCFQVIVIVVGLPLVKSIAFLGGLSLFVGLLSVLISYRMVVDELNWDVKFVSIRAVKARLCGDFSFFINGLSSGLMYNLILFMLSGESMIFAATLGLADRFLKVPLTLRNLTVHSVLPFLGSVEKKFGSLTRFLSRTLIIYFLISTFISFFFLLSTNWLLAMLNMSMPIDFQNVLLAMLMKFVFGGLSMIIVHWGLYPLKLEKRLTTPILLTNFVFFVLSVLVSFYHKPLVALWFMTGAELVLFVILFIKVNKIVNLWTFQRS